MNIIENDVFDISRRIKEIDNTYFIIYNGQRSKFELYGGKDKEYILTLPFSRLDERAVLHIRKTRIERLDKIIQEIEENNKKLEETALKDSKRQLLEQIEASTDRVLYDERYS